MILFFVYIELPRLNYRNDEDFLLTDIRVGRRARKLQGGEGLVRLAVNVVG
jgi:hypothetical protein